MERIEDDRVRRVTFKKRRVGLLKKAMQLSKLTGAKIELKIYLDEEHTFMEYYSQSEKDFQRDLKITESSKFFNHHYDLVARLEAKVNNDPGQGFNLDEQVEGIDVQQMFSLAKKLPLPTELPYLGKRNYPEVVDQICQNQVKMVDQGNILAQQSINLSPSDQLHKLQKIDQNPQTDR